LEWGGFHTSPHISEQGGQFGRRDRLAIDLKALLNPAEVWRRE
jgi:hypothetical protein